MPIQKVAVIGAGSAGRAFAIRCACAGLDVVLEDVMPSNLRRAHDEYMEFLEENDGGTLSIALTVDDAVRNADIVVDFVPDELESKLEIFCLMDRMAPPHAILCTPTDTLSITDLASCTYRAELCVGLRTSFPELTMGSVSVIRSKYCAGSTLSAVSELLTRITIPSTIVEDIPVLAGDVG